MKLLPVLFALAATCAGIATAAAQGYPSRPITMVVPFAAAGPVDTIARIMGVPMGRVLGETVVVENTTSAAGTLGVGSASHMGGLNFQNATGTEFQYIPYRGTGPALQDLVGGHIDFMVDQASNSLPHVRGGKIRADATVRKRLADPGQEIPAREQQSPEGLGARHKAEIEKWWPIVEAAGIRSE